MHAFAPNTSTNIIDFALLYGENNSIGKRRTVYHSPWVDFRQTMANENDRSPFLSRTASWEIVET
jgi:hypothetical protein